MLVEAVAKEGVSKAASSLPGAFRWAAGFVRKWRDRKSFAAQVRLRPAEATINLTDPEHGFLRVELTVVNVSSRMVNCDRVRMSGISMNTSRLPSRSEYLFAYADVQPKSPGRIGFLLELQPHEIKAIVLGIGLAQNALSDPSAKLQISGAFGVIWGKEPAEAPFDFAFPTSCIVGSAAASLRK